MTTNQLPPFEKVFGWLGLQDDDKYYKAAAALPALFFAMKQEDRERLLEGWIEAIEAFKDFSEPFPTYDEVIISETLNNVGEKGSSEIIPFKPKK